MIVYFDQQRKMYIHFLTIRIYYYTPLKIMSVLRICHFQTGLWSHRSSYSEVCDMQCYSAQFVQNL